MLCSTIKGRSVRSERKQRWRNSNNKDSRGVPIHHQAFTAVFISKVMMGFPSLSFSSRCKMSSLRVLGVENCVLSVDILSIRECGLA